MGRHVARIGGGEVHAGLWWRNLMEGNCEEAGVDRRIILKYIFKNWVGEQGLDRSSSG